MTVRADPLRARGSDVAMLSDSLRRGGSALESVPQQIKRMRDGQEWRHFTTRLGKEIHYERFAEFVTTPPLAGLGATVDLLRRICKDDKTALDAIEEMLGDGQRPGERTDLVDNIHEVRRPAGTSEAAALRRLRKDAPDLHADVLAGRLSAHAAMVQAGYRPRTVSVPVTRPETIAATLRRHMTPDALHTLAQLLAEET